MAVQVLILALIFCVTTHFAHAQAVGVQILPAIIEEAADPGQVIQQTMSIRNVSQAEQTFYLIRRDIAGVRDDATPIFAEEGMEPTGFELSSWISVTEDAITVAPGATADVPVTITVPANATPGSHFGGVFATVEPPRLRQTGAAVGYEVGSIVSIRVKGDVIETARIRSFATDKLIYGSPNVTFTTRIENPGSVLIRPRGPLEIFDMFGKRVDIITVNDSKGGVFPGTTRSYETLWKTDELAIGRYQGIVSLIYGEEGRETTVSTTVSFWVLPANIILPIVGILTFIVVAVYFGVRLHIRRTLDTYQGRGVRTVYRRRDAGITRLTMIAIGMLAAVTIFLIGLLIIFA